MSSYRGIKTISEILRVNALQKRSALHSSSYLVYMASVYWAPPLPEQYQQALGQQCSGLSTNVVNIVYEDFKVRSILVIALSIHSYPPHQGNNCPPGSLPHLPGFLLWARSKGELNKLLI